MEKISIEKEFKDKSNEEFFYMYTCVEGNGYIKGNNFVEEIKLGDSILIPATLGEYKIEGNV